MLHQGENYIVCQTKKTLPVDFSLKKKTSSGVFHILRTTLRFIPLKLQRTSKLLEQNTQVISSTTPDLVNLITCQSDCWS